MRKPSNRLQTTNPFPAKVFITASAECAFRTTSGPTLLADALANHAQSLVAFNSVALKCLPCTAILATPAHSNTWTPVLVPYTGGVGVVPALKRRELGEGSRQWTSNAEGFAWPTQPVFDGTNKSLKAFLTYIRTSLGGPSRYFTVPLTQKSRSIVFTFTGRVAES